MTKEEIRSLDMEGLEERAEAIAEEVETAETDVLDSLTEELENIEERKSEIKAEAEERKAAMDAVLEGKGEEIEKVEEERKTMDSKEVRSMPEYIDAYAEYIKGNNDGTECRSLLTTNAVIGSDEFGTVPVPTYIEDRIEGAWENDGIMSRVRRTFIRGNVRVGAELSATGAVFHAEGDEAPAEETLVLGIVDIVAQSVKKWITVSDEALALTGQAFLDYLYDEIEYQIVKAEAAKVIETIATAPTSGTTAPIVWADNFGTFSTFAEAILNAEGNAVGENLVVMANRGTIAAIKAEALGAGYAYDPFDGMTVIPCDSIPSHSDASPTDPIIIVGDLSAIQANFPEGGEVSFKFDDLSLAEQDLVKIVGRQMCGIGLVRTKAFGVILEGN